MAVTSSANIVPPPAPRKQVTVAIIPHLRCFGEANWTRLGEGIKAALAQLGATEETFGMTSALLDLLAGGQPMPHVMRAIDLFRATRLAFTCRPTLKQMTNVAAQFRGQHADDPALPYMERPAVFINAFCLDGESDSDVSGRVAALLPAELVEEVRSFSREGIQR